jgi:hypothetical protein
MANLPKSKYTEISVPIPITGSCQCKALRFECSGKPMIAFHCQCNHCQKFSSTGHSSYVLLDKSKTKVTGTFSTWSYQSDSGDTTTKHFCPACGTQVFSLVSEHENNFVASAACLDDKTLFLPSFVLFSKHAQPWDELDSSLPRYSSDA